MTTVTLNTTLSFDVTGRSMPNLFVALFGTAGQAYSLASQTAAEVVLRSGGPSYPDWTVTLRPATTFGPGSAPGEVFAGAIAWAEVRTRSGALVMTIADFGPAGVGFAKFASGDFDHLQVVGSSLSDRWLAGDANDILNGGGGDDILLGRGGNDVLRGGDGDDQLQGGTGDDIIYGDAGGDTITLTGDGVDLVGGGDGDDMIDVSIPDLGVPGAVQLDAGAGYDVVGVWQSLGSQASGPLTIYLDQAGPSAPGVWRFSGVERLEIGAWSGVRVYGGAGNDVIIDHFNSGADAFFGGAGDDVLQISGGDDLVDGGEGFDTVFLVPNDAYVGPEGRPLTVDLGLTGPQDTGYGRDTFISIERLVGHGGADTFYGSARGEVLEGGLNNDRLEGRGGDDTLDGGAGDDTLIGGDGVDAASYAEDAASVAVDLALSAAQDTGGSGVDRLEGIENLIGTAYADVLSGDAGANQLRGGVGDDRLDGREGDDVLLGGFGDDVLIGGAGVDTASYADVGTWDGRGVVVSLAAAGIQDTGAGGRDQLSGIENLVGSNWNDVLTGDAGDNRLSGGLGDNVMEGGLGADWLDGWGGRSDTASYAGAAGGVNVNLGFSGWQYVGAAAGWDVIQYVENLAGSAFDDVLRGDAGANILTGGAGDDVLEGGYHDDRLDGGEGRDTASYAGASVGVVVSLRSAGTWQTTGVTGGVGWEFLTSIENLAGSAYSDILWGDAGVNVLSGAGGADVLFDGGDSADELFGGDGDDVLVDEGGDDLLDGGAGSDTVSYARLEALRWQPSLGVTADLSVVGVQDTVRAGLQRLVQVENLIGTDFNDTLRGDAGGNRLDGGAGDDVVDGGAGADWLEGGAGRDAASFARAQAGVRADLSLAGAWQNTDGGGWKVLVGFEGLTGSAFDDVLRGDAGANVLVGGGGNDVLEGGLHDDRLDGGAGSDTASYAGSAGGVTVDLGVAGWQLAGAQTGWEMLTSIENLIGSRYADVLIGDAGDNVLEGGLHDDRLDGGAGSDTASYAGATGGVTVNLGVAGWQLIGAETGWELLTSIENVRGSAFADVLVGDGGDNVLEGGLHDDRLDGGAGTDTAAYAGSTDGVTVDLNIAGWQLVGARTGWEHLTSIENLIGSRQGDVLRGDGGANRLDGGAGDDLLVGGGGGDHLIGGLGNDVLTGGAGDDIFVFARGFGQDRITDFVAGGVEDRLDFNELVASGVTWTLGQAGADAVFSFSDGSVLTLAGVDSSNLVQVGWYWV
ncbi:calcium-binding protein [Caulobacter sp. 17J65-9]|uniref:calcium-binding protein n=1 Tax=Caulobacter sp. 17J65-9 TaxID=2709382 RepID=UPI0013C89BE7|nr:calcium-binding protein [Caulobacter sp. 17J65-9]NEX93931.1 calcium-binding protein [Caulobacter sp. 17J65-9]